MELLEQEMFMLLTTSGHVVIRIIYVMKVVVFDRVVFWNNSVSTTLRNVIAED